MSGFTAFIQERATTGRVTGVCRACGENPTEGQVSIILREFRRGRDAKGAKSLAHKSASLCSGCAVALFEELEGRVP